jgi:hypothetical protein
VHAVIQNICKSLLGTPDDNIDPNSQNVNDPEITPFAIAAGKRMCANLVKGACNAANKNGGMTSLKLIA